MDNWHPETLISDDSSLLEWGRGDRYKNVQSNKVGIVARPLSSTEDALICFSMTSENCKRCPIDCFFNKNPSKKES